MEAVIERADLCGAISAIPSKSMAHRYFIASALADTASRIRCEGDSEDIEATLRGLRAWGTQIIQQGGICQVIPAERIERKAPVRFLCGESGSTLRFLLPVTAALGIQGEFYGEGRLMRRPLSPLYEEMERHGCRLSPQGENPLHCEGKLKAGIYRLPGDVSSQYITGLLLALPLLDAESRIEITSPLQSARYVDMTLQVLEDYGIVVYREEQGYRVPGGQSYQIKNEESVEGDWSNAAFWLTAGALGKREIEINGLDMNSRQGDKKIVDLLRQMGAEIHCREDRIQVSPGQLRGIEIDASDIPDLVPVLAAAASVSLGVTRIYNAKRLRLKESDRLKTFSDMLCQLGADVRELEDGLEIHGRSYLTGGCIDAAGDHRIAMTAAVAACVCKGPVRIRGAQAVNKSYPGFYEDYQKLGGKVVMI